MVWLRAGALCLAAALAGCASFDKIVAEGRAAYQGGLYAEAEALLAPLAARGGGDRPVFLLELAMAQLAQGKLREAIEALREARDQFELYEQKLLTETLAAYLTDDTVVAYPGEDYEKILLRVVLALAELLGERRDAIAYSNQVIEKQREIVERSPEIEGRKLKANYTHLGIGRYLVGLLREESLDYSIAVQNYRQLAQLEPGFAYGAEDLARAETGVHSPAGHGVLYVFAFVDRGPFKVEVVHEPSTAAINLMWILASIIGQRLVTPSFVPVKVPDLRLPERSIQDVGVYAGGAPLRPTSELLDVGAAAVQQFAQVRDWTVARALLRRAIKKAAIEAAKRAIQHQQRASKSKSGGRGQMTDAQIGTEIGAIVATLIWEATERADTRSWGLLPASIQAVRAELPVGMHEIELAPRWGGSPAGPPVRVQTMIDDGRNAYVLVLFPTARAIPSVLVSNPPPEAPAGLDLP